MSIHDYGAGTEKQCSGCRFFNWPAVDDDKWGGMCERFPVHVKTNTSHGCAEFEKPWLRFIAYEGEPVTINAPDPRPLSARARRETMKTEVGNQLVELTPVEAKVVEWALRIEISNLQLADPMRGPGAYTSHRELKQRLSILNGVVDRLAGSA